MEKTSEPLLNPLRTPVNTFLALPLTYFIYTYHTLKLENFSEENGVHLRNESILDT